MRRIRSGAVAATAIVMTGVTACGSGARDDASGADGEPVTINSCGREVTFDKPPERVLAIGAEAPELLAAAGAGDRVTHYAGSLKIPFSPEVKRTVNAAEHVVDDSHAVSFETIVGSGVDVAIGTDISPTSDINGLAARLDKAGIKLLTVSNYCSGVEGGESITGDRPGFDLIYRDINSYGTLFDTETTAATSVENLKQRVSKVTSQMSGQTTRRAVPLYVNAQGPLGAYGGQALISEQLRTLGLRNSFGSVKKRYFEPSSEEIVSADPDIVFALYLPTGSSALETDADVSASLRDRAELSSVGAVDGDDTLLPLNFSYSSASPLAVEGLERMADQLTAADE